VLTVPGDVADSGRLADVAPFGESCRGWGPGYPATGGYLTGSRTLRRRCSTW